MISKCIQCIWIYNSGCTQVMPPVYNHTSSLKSLNFFAVLPLYQYHTGTHLKILSTISAPTYLKTSHCVLPYLQSINTVYCPLLCLPISPSQSMPLSACRPPPTPSPPTSPPSSHPSPLPLLPPPSPPYLSSLAAVAL